MSGKVWNDERTNKVITGLEHHAGIADWGCCKDSDGEQPEGYCPYYDDKDNGEPACGTKLLLDAINLIKEYRNLLEDYDSALRGMVYQYCVVHKSFFESQRCDNPNQEVFFNNYMSVGEYAFKVLGINNKEEVADDFI